MSHPDPLRFLTSDAYELLLQKAIYAYTLKFDGATVEDFMSHEFARGLANILRCSNEMLGRTDKEKERALAKVSVNDSLDATLRREGVYYRDPWKNPKRLVHDNAREIVYGPKVLFWPGTKNRPAPEPVLQRPMSVEFTVTSQSMSEGRQSYWNVHLVSENGVKVLLRFYRNAEPDLQKQWNALLMYFISCLGMSGTETDPHEVVGRKISISTDVLNLSRKRQTFAGLESVRAAITIREPAINDQ